MNITVEEDLLLTARIRRGVNLTLGPFTSPRACDASKVKEIEVRA